MDTTAKNKEIHHLILHNEQLKLILQMLCDGRAYTQTEIKNSARLENNEPDKFLSLLIKKGIVKSRSNRQRPYYYIKDPQLLTSIKNPLYSNTEKLLPTGIEYCRHCYKHLAGYVGVKLEEALVGKGLLIRQHTDNYLITDKGWNWFEHLGIDKKALINSKRLTKQYLDFSERKSHLGGKLGEALMAAFVKLKWIEQIPDSRAVKITPTGKNKLKEELLLFF